MLPDPSCILGIDPGTNFLGYGVIRTEGKKLLVGECGVLTLTHLEESSEKLTRIFERVSQLIERHRPEHLSIEAPFFGKNVQSMLKLGRAQGVAIAAALSHGLQYTEYAPRKVKMAITGRGAATKDQVAAMLEQITGTPVRLTLTEDASDALAVAICHHFQISGKGGSIGKGGGDWSSFVRKNPGRLLSS